MNPALADAKIKAEIRIRELEARGHSVESIKNLLNSREYPMLNELIDSVLRSPFQTSPSENTASEPDVDADFQRKFMELAVEEARKCKPEDERTHPKVGAVVVKDGVVLASAYRGELADGDHAEFTALEKKLHDVSLVGSTVYATLEPCTTRSPKKVPCANRLIERKVARVVFGMIDPNRTIQGEGWLRLREANLGIGVFFDDLKSELEEMNRDFIREHRKKKTEEKVSDWPAALQSVVAGIQLEWLKFDFIEFNLNEAKRIIQQGVDDLFAFPKTRQPQLPTSVVEHIYGIATEMKSLADRRVKQSCIVSPQTGDPLDDGETQRFKTDAGEFINGRLQSITSPLDSK